MMTAMLAAGVRGAWFFVLGGLCACEPAAAKVQNQFAPAKARPVATAPPVSAGSAVAPPKKPAKVDGCSVEMVRVNKSCVDRWEAHLVRVDGELHDYTQRPVKGERYEARSQADVYPQAYVNRLEAAQACDNAGKRLCTLREWFSACKSKREHLFPYGASYRAGRCNAGKPHLLGKLFGRDPRRWKFFEHFNSPKLSAEPGFLAKTGEYGDCVNDRGLADMVGNLHEWVIDSVNHDLPNKVPLRDDIRGKIDVNMGHAIFMGGFYGNVSEHGEGCAYLTPGHGKKYHDYSTGFRCCSDAQ